MTRILFDLRYALRQIRRAPGFALTTVLTLAIGISATTTIFSFVDGVLLQPLAYRDSHQLVAVWEHVPYLERIVPLTGPNPRHVSFWRDAQTVFSSLVILREGTAGVSLPSNEGGGHPQYVGRVSTEPGLLATLGIHPVLGRDFQPDEGTKGRTDRALISWTLWHTLLNGNPAALGQTILVGNAPVTVIGVLPKAFYFPKADELTPTPVAQQVPAVDILVPRQDDATSASWNGDYGNIIALGRLRPGVTPADAQTQLTGLEHNLVHQAPADQFEPAALTGLSTLVQPLHQVVTGRASRSLYLLLAAVFSVLLVACINLANAQLARVMARDREAALRTALGASAWNLIQASLLESILLSLAGGTLGIALASLALRHFADTVRVAIPRAANVTLNPTVLAVSVVCTVAATILFGVLPALHALRGRTQTALGSANRSAGSAAGTSLRRILIGVQVLACTALLLLTTLFARNLSQILTTDKGFSTGSTVLASVRLQGKAFTDPALAHFDEGALDRLRSLPGVTSAALVSSILSQGETWVDATKPAGVATEQSLLTQLRWVSPDYFTTIGQRILAGRPLDARDRISVPEEENGQPGKTSPPTAAVLSQSTANALWPGQDPLQRLFQRGNNRTYVVVGIAADARTNSPHEAPVAMAFLPFWDNPPALAFFLVHTAGDPTALLPAVRTAIWQQNPTVTIADVRPFDATFADTLAPERLQTTLLAAFGIAALLLALIGIYGTLNYSIGRRTQEFGIRMALGASRGDVYRLTLAEVAAPIAAGLLGGWLVSIALTRVARSLLEGTATPGPTLTAAVLGILLAATLLATYFPCRRASRLQPMDALRTE